MDATVFSTPTGATDDISEIKDKALKKAQIFLDDERVKATLTVISVVAPLAAGPLASSAGKVLPAVAKGLKHAPQAINCIMTMAQI